MQICLGVPMVGCCICCLFSSPVCATTIRIGQHRRQINWCICIVGEHRVWGAYIDSIAHITAINNSPYMPSDSCMPSWVEIPVVASTLGAMLGRNLGAIRGRTVH
jgi:hypothetical protein